MRPERIISYTDHWGREIPDCRSAGNTSEISPEVSNPYNISIQKFKEILLLICDKETSAAPENWTKENPLLGHCAVVSLLAQDLFGGDLLRASLLETEFAYMRSHYWNKLPDGQEIDFTASQFGDKYPKNLTPEIKERSYVLSYKPTEERYKLLVSRLEQALRGDVTLQREAALTANPAIATQLTLTEADAQRVAKYKVHPDDLPCGHLEPTANSNYHLKSTGNIVVIITGTFAGGKDTIAREILNDPSLRTTKAILFTSRPMGNNETNGADYFFVSRDEFIRMRDANEFLSWNDLEPGFYGVHLQSTKDLLDSKKDLVAAVGPTVAKPLKKGLDAAKIPYIEIFVLPVTIDSLTKPEGIDNALEILRKRLIERGRGKTDENFIELLLERSRLWLSRLGEFQHVVENPNGGLEDAVKQTKKIIETKKQEVFESLSPRDQFDNFGYVSESYFQKHKLKSNGNIAITITGPTGVGKGTIVKKLLEDPTLKIKKGVGNTTRPPRAGEKEGVDYFYLTKDEFQEKIKSGELLEWTIVHNGHLYGYSEKVSQSIFDSGHSQLTELDPGAVAFYKYVFGRLGIPHVDIFISPIPKEDLNTEAGIEKAIFELRRRVEIRGGNETPAQVDERMKLAREWLRGAHKYSYIIENTEGNLDKAVVELASIIKQKKLEASASLGLPSEMLASLNS